ncbi:MAG: hypothetical protein E1N59_2223 [Puniceicoccaceae bacterium 5H]|nr:MAG: hypothetical protein E1N59_2223 [Puniceicoccaceae bacterium 5H]
MMKRRGFSLLELTIALSLLAAITLTLVAIFRSSLQAVAAQTTVAEVSRVEGALYQLQDEWHHLLPPPQADPWLIVRRGELAGEGLLLKAAWLDEEQSLFWQALVLVPHDAFGEPSEQYYLAKVTLTPTAVHAARKAGTTLENWNPLVQGQPVVIAGPMPGLALHVGHLYNGEFQSLPLPDGERYWRPGPTFAQEHPVMTVHWQEKEAFQGFAMDLRTAVPESK